MKMVTTVNTFSYTDSRGSERGQRGGWRSSECCCT